MQRCRESGRTAQGAGESGEDEGDPGRDDGAATEDGRRHRGSESAFRSPQRGYEHDQISHGEPGPIRYKGRGQQPPQLELDQVVPPEREVTHELWMQVRVDSRR